MLAFKRSSVSGLPEGQRTLVKQYQESAPVNLKGLAQSLGLKVLGATLDPGISGEIRPDRSTNSFVIRVDRHEPRTRQRFTVAHEIAHYLLHKEEIGDGITDDFLYRSRLTSSREAEANRLAADILMPMEMFRQKWTELGGVSSEENIQAMADFFDVSKAAIRIRLGLD